MARIFRGTFSLLLLNVLIFACIYFFQKTDVPKNIPLFSWPELLNVNFNDIHTLQISGPLLKEKRVFKKNTVNWVIEEPIEWPANTYAILNIFHKLQLLEQDTVLAVDKLAEKGQDLEEYGLVEPSLVLDIVDSQKKYTFTFGAFTKVGERVYVLGPDQKYIYAVSKSIIDAVCLPLNDFESSNIFGLSNFEVQGITLRAEAQQSTTILSKRSGQWYFEAPIQTQANLSLVEAAINELLHLKINKILSPKEAEKIKVSTFRVTLLGPDQSQTLRIGDILDVGSQSSEYPAKLEGSATMFTIPSTVVENLLKAQDTLRERQLLQFNKDQIDAISIVSGAKNIILQRLETGQWNCTYTDSNTPSINLSKAADAKLVKKIIKYLSSIEAIHFTSDAPSEAEREGFGLNTPSFQITLSWADNKISLSVGAISEKEELLYAQSSNAPFVYEISRKILDILPLDPLHYYDRILYAKPEKAFMQSAKLICLSNQKVFFDIECNTPDQDLALPHLSSNQIANLKDFLGQLSSFKVRSYLAEHFNPKGYIQGEVLHPWEFLLTVNLFLPGLQEGECQVMQYYFTKRLGGMLQVGGSVELQREFRLTQEMMDALFAVTFEKKAIQVDPSTGKLEVPEATLDEPCLIE